MRAIVDRVVALIPGKKQIGLAIVLWAAYGLVEKGALPGEVWLWAAITAVGGIAAVADMGKAWLSARSPRG